MAMPPPPPPPPPPREEPILLRSRQRQRRRQQQMMSSTTEQRSRSCTKPRWRDTRRKCGAWLGSRTGVPWRRAARIRLCGYGHPRAQPGARGSPWRSSRECTTAPSGQWRGRLAVSLPISASVDDFEKKKNNNKQKMARRQFLFFSFFGHKPERCHQQPSARSLWSSLLSSFLSVFFCFHSIPGAGQTVESGTLPDEPGST